MVKDVVEQINNKYGKMVIGTVDDFKALLATEAQKSVLTRFHITYDNNITKQEASKLIDDFYANVTEEQKKCPYYTIYNTSLKKQKELLDDGAYISTDGTFYY